MTGANGNIAIYPSRLKGSTENDAPLPCSAPGPVLWFVLGGASFVVEPSGASAGCSVFSCSAAWATASSTGLYLEVVWFRSGSTGVPGCRG